MGISFLNHHCNSKFNFQETKENTMLKQFKLLFTISFFMLSAQVLAAQPTAAQMDQFRSLPESQQKALASQYGIDLDDLNGVDDQRQTRPLSTESTIRPRMTEKELAERELTALEKELEEQEEESGLPMFGYDLFAGEPTTTVPLSDLPVPNDYILGVGDEIVIKVFGKDKGSYKLMVHRDGTIDIPKLGPLNVRGLTYQQVKEELEKQIKRRMIGVDVTIRLGKLKTIQVFVLGAAYKPGAYTLSSMSTLTQAIKAAGGIAMIGSMREIEIKRRGEENRKIDLYDLLISGDISSDTFLRQGDVVFIPVKQKIVSIDGFVKRPAIYELKDEKNSKQVMVLAGGLNVNARPNLRVSRQTETGFAIFDVKNESQDKFKIKNGDEIFVDKASDLYSNAVYLGGSVNYPGPYPWVEGLRISNLIQSIDVDLSKDVDLDNGLIVREVGVDREIKILHFNLLDALSNPESALNLKLSREDKILILNKDSVMSEISHVRQRIKEEKVVEEKYSSQSDSPNSVKNDSLDSINDKSLTNSNFNKSQIELDNKEVEDELSVSELGEKTEQASKAQEMRTEILKPLIAELKSQATHDSEVQIVDIRGAVKFPGVYPLFEDADIKTLISLAGGLKEASYLQNAEMSRFTSINGREQLKYIDIDLNAVLQGNRNANLKLQSKDRIQIFTRPEWREDYKITLSGEVRFPGTYNFNRGETMLDVIKRAGGLTEYAYAQGAIFSRESLRLIEDQQLKFLHRQLQEEVATLSFRQQSSTNPVSGPNSQDAMQTIDSLGQATALGRMSINLDKILMADKDQNINLENEDKLHIPPLRKVISVIGHVQFPTSHIYEPGKTLEDYLNLSGGAKMQADDDRVYVIRANGSVYVPNESFWFFREDPTLKPGDTIVMPIDTMYMDTLTAWTSGTQILYQLGVAWSAIKN